jgi:hypothetical protein
MANKVVELGQVQTQKPRYKYFHFSFSASFLENT